MCVCVCVGVWVWVWVCVCVSRGGRGRGAQDLDHILLCVHSIFHATLLQYVLYIPLAIIQLWGISSHVRTVHMVTPCRTIMVSLPDPDPHRPLRPVGHRRHSLGGSPGLRKQMCHPALPLPPEPRHAQRHHGRRLRREAAAGVGGSLSRPRPVTRQTCQSGLCVSL